MAGIRMALAVMLMLIAAASVARAHEACRIEIVERGSGWPVPLVELRTVHELAFVSDNAGVIAMDAPELMDREAWFHVRADGYEVPADGFGYRGVRLTCRPGATLRVEVTRTMIARRLGRITGAGQLAESRQLGDHRDRPESPILGCDSVQVAAHRGRLFWLWGDTSLPGYPLGIFHSSSATTPLRPLISCEPPLDLRFDWFTNERGTPRGVAQMPGDGPTWLGGYVSLPDAAGRARLVATYARIKPPLEACERGLCVWNDDKHEFERLRVLWKKSDESPQPGLYPDGHPAIVDGPDGQRWLYLGNPLPTFRCPATFEAWRDEATWERLEPQEALQSAADGSAVKPHSGSIAYSAYRRRWVTVFMQAFGQPSAFGEVWYAEADTPTGPWGPAVKVLSHRNYTFYNPRLHADFTPPDSPILLFEGTCSQMFADDPAPTPRYDYNQLLYRLDLDDQRLTPAHSGQNP